MHNGIAIILAWPETYCKRAGSWYDILMHWASVSKDHYYKIGHAAIVLIENKTGDCHYFDFGRYHAPHQHGRVRSGHTDHDLIMKSKALLNNRNLLENYEEILLELQSNESCHGSGTLHASYCAINFDSAFAKANEMQGNSPIAYGPFIPEGTNCSRFVRTVALAGKPKLLHKISLGIPLTFSPTPIGNVKAVANYKAIAKNSVEQQTFSNPFPSL